MHRWFFFFNTNKFIEVNNMVEIDESGELLWICNSRICNVGHKNEENLMEEGGEERRKSDITASIHKLGNCTLVTRLLCFSRKNTFSHMNTKSAALSTRETIAWNRRYTYSSVPTNNCSFHSSSIFINCFFLVGEHAEIHTNWAQDWKATLPAVTPWHLIHYG